MHEQLVSPEMEARIAERFEIRDAQGVAGHVLIFDTVEDREFRWLLRGRDAALAFLAQFLRAGCSISQRPREAVMIGHGTSAAPAEGRR